MHNLPFNSDSDTSGARGVWRAFFIIALFGVATTAYNTTIPMFYAPAPVGIEAQAVLRHDWLRLSRDWVLILHAFVTMLAPLGLTLLLWRTNPAIGLVAFLFTFIEKQTELYLQTVRVFTLNGVWRKQILESQDPAITAYAIDSIRFFNAIWNDAFFILWLCGALAALLYGLALVRATDKAHRIAGWVAISVAVLALPWIATDYLGVPLPPLVPDGLYAVVMTSYRAMIAWLLYRAMMSCNHT
jgi:hypothetical protein